MKKIIFIFLLSSSLCFAINEKKYGFETAEKNKFGFITTCEMGVPGSEDKAKLMITAFYDFGIGDDQTKVTKALYNDFFTFYPNRDADILDLFNDGHRQIVYAKNNSFVFYIERFFGEIRYVTLINSHKADVKEFNSNIIEYVLLNGIASKEKTDKLLNYLYETEKK